MSRFNASRFVKALHRGQLFSQTYRSVRSFPAPIKSSGNRLFYWVTGVSSVAVAFLAHQNYSADQQPVLKNKSANTGKNTTGIRELQSPEIIFKQYASIVNEEGEHLMTVGDFLRVITPFESPDSNFDTTAFSTYLSKIMSSIDQNSDGLISFDEFMFFTTLLSIPPKFFRISFQMFDEDGNGSVDINEFRNAMRLIQQASPITRQNLSSLSLLSNSVASYPVFFGSDGKKQLKFEAFENFVTELREAVLHVQFKILSQGEDTISASDYAKNIISYAPHKYQGSFNDKIQKLDKSDIRISYKEHKSFILTLECLHEIEFALKSFISVGKPFSKKQLARATSAVTQEELSPNLLDVIFTIFAKSEDGNLDCDEFLDTLAGRQVFGFSAPRDNPVVRLGKCAAYCWSEEISTRSAKALNKQ